MISRTLTGNFVLSEYAIDRCCRILLPLVPAVLFTGLLNIFSFGEPVAPTVLLGNTTGLNGLLVPTLNHNAPLWSLTYEIWFYLLGGVVGYIISRADRRVSVGAVMALLACAAVFSILSARLLLYWVIAAIMCRCLDSKHKGWLGILGVALALFGVDLQPVCHPEQILRQRRGYSAGSRSIADLLWHLPRFARRLQQHNERMVDHGAKTRRIFGRVLLHALPVSLTRHWQCSICFYRGRTRSPGQPFPTSSSDVGAV